MMMSDESECVLRYDADWNITEEGPTGGRLADRSTQRGTISGSSAAKLKSTREISLTPMYRTFFGTAGKRCVGTEVGPHNVVCVGFERRLCFSLGMCTNAVSLVVSLQELLSELPQNLTEEALAEVLKKDNAAISIRSVRWAPTATAQSLPCAALLAVLIAPLEILVVLSVARVTVGSALEAEFVGFAGTYNSKRQCHGRDYPEVPKTWVQYPRRFGAPWLTSSYGQLRRKQQHRTTSSDDDEDTDDVNHSRKYSDGYETPTSSTSCDEHQSKYVDSDEDPSQFDGSSSSPPKTELSEGEGDETPPPPKTKARRKPRDLSSSAHKNRRKRTRTAADSAALLVPSWSLPNVLFRRVAGFGFVGGTDILWICYDIGLFYYPPRGKASPTTSNENHPLYGGLCSDDASGKPTRGISLCAFGDTPSSSPCSVASVCSYSTRSTVEGTTAAAPAGRRRTPSSSEGMTDTTPHRTVIVVAFVSGELSCLEVNEDPSAAADGTSLIVTRQWRGHSPIPPSVMAVQATVQTSDDKPTQQPLALPLSLSPLCYELIVAGPFYFARYHMTNNEEGVLVLQRQSVIHSTSSLECTPLSIHFHHNKCDEQSLRLALIASKNRLTVVRFRAEGEKLMGEAATKPHEQPSATDDFDELFRETAHRRQVRPKEEKEEHEAIAGEEKGGNGQQQGDGDVVERVVQWTPALLKSHGHRGTPVGVLGFLVDPHGRGYGAVVEYWPKKTNHFSSVLLSWEYMYQQRQSFLPSSVAMSSDDTKRQNQLALLTAVDDYYAALMPAAWFRGQPRALGSVQLVGEDLLNEDYLCVQSAYHFARETHYSQRAAVGLGGGVSGLAAGAAAGWGHQEEPQGTQIASLEELKKAVVAVAEQYRTIKSSAYHTVAELKQICCRLSQSPAYAGRLRGSSLLVELLYWGLSSSMPVVHNAVVRELVVPFAVDAVVTNGLKVLQELRQTAAVNLRLLSTKIRTALLAREWLQHYLLRNKGGNSPGTTHKFLTHNEQKANHHRNGNAKKGEAQGDDPLDSLFIVKEFNSLLTELLQSFDRELLTQCTGGGNNKALEQIMEGKSSVRLDKAWERDPTAALNKLLVAEETAGFHLVNRSCALCQAPLKRDWSTWEGLSLRCCGHSSSNNIGTSDPPTLQEDPHVSLLSPRTFDVLLVAGSGSRVNQEQEEEEPSNAIFVRCAVCGVCEMVKEEECSHQCVMCGGLVQP